MIGLGGGDELGLRLVEAVGFEVGQGDVALVDVLADAGVVGAVALGLKILDEAVLVHLVGNQQAGGVGIHAGDVGAEQVLLVEGGTARLGVEVQTTVRSDGAGLPGLPT